MSSHVKSPGTTATPPAAATGSAIAWSIAILVSPGQTRSSTSARSGPSHAAAISCRPAASAGSWVGQVVQQHARPHDEHAGVPAVLAGRQVRGRGHGVGLLREAGGTGARVGAPSRPRGAPERTYPNAVDGPVAAMPMVDDVPGPRRHDALAHRLLERLGAVDHVVGGERPEDHVLAVPLEQDRGGQADRRHRVAGRRLREHVGRHRARGAARRPPSACRVPVTTSTPPAPVSGSSRSTVACSSVRPDPVRSSRNLGWPARDSGHSRVPAPAGGDDGVESGDREGGVDMGARVASPEMPLRAVQYLTGGLCRRVAY